jgi:hypothetical protein
MTAHLKKKLVTKNAEGILKIKVGSFLGTSFFNRAVIF